MSVHIFGEISLVIIWLSGVENEQSKDLMFFQNQTRGFQTGGIFTVKCLGDEMEAGEKGSELAGDQRPV